MIKGLPGRPGESGVKGDKGPVGAGPSIQLKQFVGCLVVQHWRNVHGRSGFEISTIERQICAPEYYYTVRDADYSRRIIEERIYSIGGEGYFPGGGPIGGEGFFPGGGPIGGEGFYPVEEEERNNLDVGQDVTQPWDDALRPPS